MLRSGTMFCASTVPRVAWRLGRQGGLSGKGIVVPVQLAQLDLNALGGNGEMVDLFLGRIAQQRQGGSNGDHSHETERQGNGENTFLFM